MYLFSHSLTPKNGKFFDIATANVVAVLYIVVAVWFDNIFRDLE